MIQTNRRTNCTNSSNTAGRRQYQPELHGFIDPKAVAEAEADLEEMKVALTGSIRITIPMATATP